MRFLSLIPFLASFAPAQQFTALPMISGDDVVAPSAGNQRRPALATGANGQTLLVFEDDRSSLVDTVFGGQAVNSSSPGNFDVYGTFLDATGRPTSRAPFAIAASTWDQLRPRAAWNGSSYLVVFDSSAPTTFFHSRGIYAVRVDAGGNVLDNAPIRIDDDDNVDEGFAVVAAVGTGWVVAWADSNGTVSTVQAALVDAAGVVAAQKPVLVTGTVTHAPTQHALAASGNQLLLAWSIDNGSGVRARRFDASGAPIGSELSLSQTIGLRPAVASDGAGYYVTWYGNGQVFGTPIDTAGVLGTPSGAALGLGSGDSELAVGHDGAEWIVAVDNSPTVGIARVSATGTPLGTRTVATSSRSVDDIAVGSRAGDVIVAWTDRRMTPNAFGVDQDDVFGAVVTGGIATPATALSISPPAQVADALAGDAEHGILCVYRSLDAGVTRIQAVPLDANGAQLTAPFVVHSGDRSLGRPDVAWNGNEFVVVWSQRMSIVVNGPPPLVFAKRVRIDGTALDPTPVLVMEGTLPVVDAVGDVFLIVTQFQHVVLQVNGVVRGRQLHGPSGGFLGAPIDILVGASLPVDVVGLRDRWLVAWGRVTAAFVTAAGVPGAPFYAADAGSGSGVTRLACNAAKDEAVLVYQHRVSTTPHPDVRMRRFALGGGSPDPLLGPLVAGQNHGQWRPTVVALDGEYLAAWADHRDSLDIEPGIGDVYAARLAPNGTLLEPLGIPVLDTPAAEGSQMAIRTGRGSALLIASQAGGAGFASHRLRSFHYENAATTPWAAVGNGLRGTAGIPQLDGYGTLAVGEPFDLTLRAARANAPCVLALGFGIANVPLFGGVWVPTPDLTAPAMTSALGEWTFDGVWPPAAAGTNFYTQCWLLDPGGVQGFAATPGLRGTSR